MQKDNDNQSVVGTFVFLFDNDNETVTEMSEDDIDVLKIILPAYQ